MGTRLSAFPLKSRTEPCDGVYSPAGLAVSKGDPLAMYGLSEWKRVPVEKRAEPRDGV